MWLMLGYSTFGEAPESYSRLSIHCLTNQALVFASFIPFLLRDANLISIMSIAVMLPLLSTRFRVQCHALERRDCSFGPGPVRSCV